MASPCGTFSLFPDLNDSPIEVADTSSFEPRQSAPAPTLSFPGLPVEQLMAVQSDIDANHYTQKSCVEAIITDSNLSYQLQSRTNEVHQLKAQLSLFHSMFQDARKEITQLKKRNTKLKR
ncbi:hypothetical protein ACSBR2_039268 [Camellia fascicularis]